MWGAVEWYSILFLHNKSILHKTLLFTCQMLLWKDVFAWTRHVWVWELDYKESWALKNWCFWTVVLEKTLESPLDFKEIQSVHPKGDGSWVFIGRTDAGSWNSNIWPPDKRSWLIWKDLDAGKDWGQGEKGTEDEMVGWHHDSMDMSLGKLWELVIEREA